MADVDDKTLSELADAAGQYRVTPWPAECGDGEYGGATVWADDGDEVAELRRWGDGGARALAYIAAAHPARITALLEEKAALQAEVERLRRACDRDESEVSPYGDDQRVYPCDDCDRLRTKAQGGTVFTVCEDCWDKRGAL